MRKNIALFLVLAVSRAALPALAAEISVGPQASAVPAAAPLPATWPQFFAANGPLLAKLSPDYALPAGPLERLMARAGVQLESFLAKDQAAQISALRRGAEVIAQGEFERMLRLTDGSPSVETVKDWEEMSASLNDLTALLPLMPPGEQDGFVLGHHLVLARLEEYKEAKSKETIAPALRDWKTPADDAPVTRGDAIRQLSISLQAVSKNDKPEDHLSKALLAHAKTVAALESAGGAARTHAHVFGLMQKRGADGLDRWLGFFKESIMPALSLDVADEGAWRRLDSVAHGYAASEGAAAEAYRLKGEQPGQDLRMMLKHAEPAHLDRLVLKFMAGATRDSRESLEKFLEKMKTSSREPLRAAINLVHSKLFGNMPSVLWDKLLAQPPLTKQEREALTTVAKLLPSIKMSDGVKMTVQARAAAETLDYRGLQDDLFSHLLGGLAAYLKLSPEAAARLKQPEFLRALGRERLLNNILTLTTFLNKDGQKSLARLVEELTSSRVEKDRILHTARYDRLEGKVPEAVLSRWRQDFGASEAVQDAVEASSFDAAPHRANLAAALAVASPAELDALKPKVEALSARLAGELDAAQKERWLGELEGLVPALQALLGALEEGDAPSAERVKSVIPLLGKPKWMKEVFANPEAVLAAAKRLMGALSPKKAAPSDLTEKLHTTDDPALMLSMGNDPILTCQRCTESTGYNTKGQPVSRVLLGQIKLGYWTKGGKLTARTVLELGRDDKGRPALLVERLYFNSADKTDQESLRESLIAYARWLGVDTVYFADESRSGKGWPVAAGRRRYAQHSQQWLEIYHDTFDGRRTAAASLFGPGPFVERRDGQYIGIDADGRFGVAWNGRFIALKESAGGEGNYSAAYALEPLPGQSPLSLVVAATDGDAELVRWEARALRRLDGTRIPHGRFFDRGGDGRLFMRTAAAGARMSEISPKGWSGFTPEQKAAYVELAARFVELRKAPFNARLTWDGKRFVVDSLEALYAAQRGEIEKVFANLLLGAGDEFRAMLEARLPTPAPQNGFMDDLIESLVGLFQ